MVLKLIGPQTYLKVMEHPAQTYHEAMPGKIYIVVPVFNRKSFTQRFLYCMRKQTFRNFEIIVVDDGSTDGTAELIAEQFREVQLLRGDGNLWWTGAINLGIRHAMVRASEADAILVINDDIDVNSDYLETLHGLRKSMSKMLIGSVLVDIKNPEVIYDGGRIVNWWTAKVTMLNSKRKLSEFEENHYVDVSLLTGSGTLIPIQVFREIGLYDDKHFQQCGDTELPVRAKNVGYRLIVSYAAIAKMHIDASDSVNVSSYYSLRDLNKYFFSIKSNFRLKYHFFFGLNTATNPFALVSFLLFDLLRITCHFLLRLRFR
jgi:N-acetylglucosaminyl-diphospho-decaprenol L-rhamnosyltransferase